MPRTIRNPPLFLFVRKKNRFEKKKTPFKFVLAFICDAETVRVSINRLN